MGDQYRTLVEENCDGIFVLREDTFIFCNERFAELTNHPQTALESSSLSALVHPGDRDRVRDINRRHIEGAHAPARYDARVRTNEEETRLFEFCVDRITFEGEMVLLGAVRDVTDRRKREARIDDLASIVAHDIRNPINVLAGRVELARETGDDQHFDAMARSIDQIETMLTEFRELGRLGLPLTDASMTDLAECANDAWEQLPHDSGTITIGDLPTVDGDPERLTALFAELFENAIEHGGDDVEIRVESIEGGITISDDGTGIAETDIDRVFEPGFTTDPERNGFGLTAVEWIVQAHGWSVTVNESEAGGARFEIRLDEIAGGHE